MFGRLCDEQLIEPDPQKVAKANIDVAFPKVGDPEIEQRQISEDTIEKLERECEICGRKMRLGERVRDYRVCEIFPSSPSSERGQGDSPSRDLRHEAA